MDIVFENSKFEEECNNQRLRLKKHGADRAKRILQRLDDLRDANVLEDMRNLPMIEQVHYRSIWIIHIG
jgi:proteic killer suppression protein